MGKLKSIRSWFSERKTVLIGLLIILATIGSFLNASWQSSKSELQSVLLYKVGIAAMSYSAFGANNTEINLQQVIAEWCLTHQQTTIVERGSCGSNKVILQEATYQHDSLEGGYIQAADDASSTLADYNAESPRYDSKIAISGCATLFLLLTAFLVNFL